MDYIYDSWRVIQERDTGGNLPLASYTRGNDLSGNLEGAGGIGGLLARSSGYSSGNWTSHACYHADGNGNITCLIATNQSVVASYRYDPFGNTLSKSGTPGRCQHLPLLQQGNPHQQPDVLLRLQVL